MSEDMDGEKIFVSDLVEQLASDTADLVIKMLIAIIALDKLGNPVVRPGIIRKPIAVKPMRVRSRVEPSLVNVFKEMEFVTRNSNK